MRILYVTQWFEPEPAFKGADFAEGLAAKGHHVEVATGFPNYPGGRLYPGFRIRPYKCEVTPGGIRVHRLPLFPSHDRSTVGRSLNYLSFFLSCLVFGLLRGWKYDAVYVYHPPVTPSLAMSLVAMLYRFRLVIDIQDLWPDSVAVSGMASPRTVRVLDALCGFVYRHADHIVVQADGMRARLAKRGVPEAKLTRIYNWATYEPAGRDAEVPDSPEFSGQINVVYGGNLGQAQALAYVVDAVRIARRQVPGLRLHLYGDGIERNALVERSRNEPEANLIVHGAVNRKLMDRVFDSADVLILHLKDDPLYEFTIPSKTQHYLACGKPVVAGLRGEAASILDKSLAAFVYEPENSEALARGLVALGGMTAEKRSAMGKRGAEYYRQNFSMAAALDQTLAVLGTGGEAERTGKFTEAGN